MKVVITGANGFVGRALAERLVASNVETISAVRRTGTAAGGTQELLIEDISSKESWLRGLQGAETVYHLAGYAHVLGSSDMAAFQRVNVGGMEAVAAAAVAAGVKRVVFLSSAKVNGEATHVRPFDEKDPPDPADSYGTSKWQAEQALRRICEEAGCHYTVVRTPLVYGPHVRANFLTLIRLVDRGVPLPFGAVQNLRSFAYVGNLVDALLRCADPAANGELYYVSDQDDVSTGELIRRIAAALNRPARLVSLPPGLIRGAAGILGKRGAADRLLGSLQVDSGKISRSLRWTPPYRMSEGLAATADWYRSLQEAG